MARSKVKHKYLKCAKSISNKDDRSKANRRMRRKTRELLAKGEEFLPLLRDISDPWDFKSDGLAIYINIKIPPKYYRK